jgi:hypothetical protein
MLVLNPDHLANFIEVYPDGRRQPCDITHDEALEFAAEAAKAFKVGKISRNATPRQVITPRKLGLSRKRRPRMGLKRR